MSPELLTAIAAVLAQVASLTVAVTILYGQVRRYRHQVNSRMDELLAETRASARAEGQLEEGARARRETLYASKSLQNDP